MTHSIGMTKSKTYKLAEAVEKAVQAAVPIIVEELRLAGSIPTADWIDFERPAVVDLVSVKVINQEDWDKIVLFISNTQEAAEAAKEAAEAAESKAALASEQAAEAAGSADRAVEYADNASSAASEAKCEAGEAESEADGAVEAADEAAGAAQEAYKECGTALDFLSSLELDLPGGQGPTIGLDLIEIGE
jgi:hypothetical protein